MVGYQSVEPEDVVAELPDVFSDDDDELPESLAFFAASAPFL